MLLFFSEISQAHLTKRQGTKSRFPFATQHGSFSGSGTRSGRRRVWFTAVVLAVVLLAAGHYSNEAQRKTIQEQVRATLETMLRTETEAVVDWIEGQKRHLRLAAVRHDLRRATQELNELSREYGGVTTDISGSQQAELLRILQPLIEEPSFSSWAITSTTGEFLASSKQMRVGAQLLDFYRPFLQRALLGELVLGLPHQEGGLCASDASARKIGMFVVGPIRDESGRIIAALSLEFDSDADFTRLLGTGTIGNSGETYAFDPDGFMLSASRFEQQLWDLGILPDKVPSILNLQVHAPAGDMAAGFKPDIERRDMPKTRMAESALHPYQRPEWPQVANDIGGYRDYRGVQVVGAWTWLTAYGFGITHEVDYEEAFAPMRSLRVAYVVLLSVLVLSAAMIILDAFRMVALRRKTKSALLSARKLDRYQLERKIGQGGMGQVYLAQHEMLKRPAAVKILTPDIQSDESVSRFEREVQMTCRLTHPNTVEIYDYGRTPDKLFYYVMEHLDGTTLDRMVREKGPMHPGRVIHLLQQICASLYEAHSKNLIHRDIKMQNIFVCRRGLEDDFVKVLDFGLVKKVKRSPELTISSPNAIAGTPMYMSPEAVRSISAVDGRSDLYALGIVGYYLLCGDFPFDRGTPMSICMKQVNDIPPLPSIRSKIHVPVDIEQVIMRCLEKSPADRFQTAYDLSRALGRCEAAGTWTGKDATRWWRQWREEHDDETVRQDSMVSMTLADQVSHLATTIFEEKDVEDS